MLLHGSTGRPELDAADDFTRARRGAFVDALWRRSTGRAPSQPRTLDAARVTPGGRPRLEVLALAEIVGTVDPAPGFDERLRPASRHVRTRWEGIARAHRRGTALPPVVVWRTAEGVFVLDGRHRVSVARALGLRDLDAWAQEARLT